MGTAATHAEPTDRDLAVAIGERDEAAFHTLFERYVDALHDFSLRIVGDHQAADDVVQLTFVKVWQLWAGVGSEIRNVKAWLFSVARNNAIDEIRRHQRAVPTEDTALDFAAVDPDHAGDADAARLVWEAASALNPGDHALLEMQLRQGLSPTEIGEALGLNQSAVHTRLSRLKDALEESVVALLLDRYGRRDCRELDRRLSALGPGASPRRIRKTVRLHLRDCEVCEASKRTLVAPSVLFSALVPIHLAVHDRARLWTGVSQAMHVPAPTHRPYGRWAAGGAGAAAVVAAIVLLLRPGGSTKVPDPSDVRSVTHQVDVASTNHIIVMRWTERHGATGYSYVWRQTAGVEPSPVAILPGDATGAVSPVLSAGEWWFVMRTRGHRANAWTDTVRAGPFVIVASTADLPADAPAPPTSLAPTADAPTVTPAPRAHDAFPVPADTAFVPTTDASSPATPPTTAPPTTAPPTTAAPPATAPPTTSPPTTAPPTTSPPPTAPPTTSPPPTAPPNTSPPPTYPPQTNPPATNPPPTTQPPRRPPTQG